jgi:hypothetical protein
VEILKDHKHEEYEETIKWLMEEYDPEEFTVDEVAFDDPQARYEEAFED